MRRILKDDRGQQIRCPWRVADVTRPLHSVSRVTGPEEGDGDHDVLFTNKKCVVVPLGVEKILATLAIKPVTEYKRKGGLYVAKMKMSGITRQGAQR